MPKIPRLLQLLALAAVASCSADGGPSPLVAGLTVRGPQFLLVGDTGSVTAVALDTSGHVIPSATVTFVNTTPDVALLLPDGTFIGRRPGMLVLTATSGGVEQELDSWIVDSSCGRVAAVPGWTAGLGVAYALQAHHVDPLIGDSFDIHLSEDGSVSGASLITPFAIDGETVEWSTGAVTSVAVSAVDTLHHGGIDSVFAEHFASAFPPNYRSLVLLRVQVDQCSYMLSAYMASLTAVTGPGIQGDSGTSSLFANATGTMAGATPLSSGPDSATLGVVYHTSTTGSDDTNQGFVIPEGGLFAAIAQPPGTSVSPFGILATSWDSTVVGILGTARAVWTITPALASSAPPPASSRRSALLMARPLAAGPRKP